MNILLLGASGQVGSELSRTLQPLGHVIACTRKQIDLSDLTTLNQQINTINPDIIVNAAAYTAVDRAETEKNLANTINHDAVALLAQWCANNNRWLIHYSTDYVFDGQKNSPYEENDPINPINVYGETKALGENAIRAAKCPHLILRTSWVYGLCGHNFPNTILRLAKEKDCLNIVGDQIGVPTSAELIADVTALILNRIITSTDFNSGTYHLTPSGATTWYDFADYLIKDKNKIKRITTAEYPTPAKRPLNSLLNTQKITEDFGIVLPAWQCHVDRFLKGISK